MPTRSRNDHAPRKLRTILFVGRSPDRYAPVWRQLALRNATLLFAETRYQAERTARRIPIHTVIVDDSSLNGSSLQTCRKMRTLTPAAAIVLISDAVPTPSWVCDYHVPAPADGKQLVMAVEDARPGVADRHLAAGAFALDRVTSHLKGPTGNHKLSPKLAELMAFFLEREGQAQSRVSIMQQVWHTSYLGDQRTLDVHMCLLRRLVEPDPSQPNYLLTVRGVGYVFYPEGRPTKHEYPDFGA